MTKKGCQGEETLASLNREGKYNWSPGFSSYLLHRCSCRFDLPTRAHHEALASYPRLQLEPGMRPGRWSSGELRVVVPRAWSPPTLGLTHRSTFACSLMAFPGETPHRFRSTQVSYQALLLGSLARAPPFASGRCLPMLSVYMKLHLLSLNLLYYQTIESLSSCTSLPRPHPIL